jgi:hypothetical protein
MQTTIMMALLLDDDDLLGRKSRGSCRQRESGDGGGAQDKSFHVFFLLG